MQSKSLKDIGGQLPRDREDFGWKGPLEASTPNRCSQMGWAGTKSRRGCSGPSPGKSQITQSVKLPQLAWDTHSSAELPLKAGEGVRYLQL